MVKALRTILFAGLLTLTTSIVVISTVACNSINSLSYMPDDVLEKLGFISRSDNDGSLRYTDNVDIGNSINFQVNKNDNATVNWDFSNIEDINLANLINKSNNLGWTEDINNFLINKLQLKLNSKKEFNLDELNNYHLKVLTNNLKVIWGGGRDRHYYVSQQDLAVQWLKSSRNGPIFLKDAKFKLHIIKSSLNDGFNWSTSKDDWFDTDKLTNIVDNVPADDSRLNVTDLNNALTKKAKSVLNAYNILLEPSNNRHQFSIYNAIKERKTSISGDSYWVINLFLGNPLISFSIEIVL